MDRGNRDFLTRTPELPSTLPPYHRPTPTYVHSADNPALVKLLSLLAAALLLPSLRSPLTF